MTYSLPFGLKQKPLRHYFSGGSISFLCIEGQLLYTITMTNKHTKFIQVARPVYTKYELDKLLSIKSSDEIPTIEVVN